MNFFNQSISEWYSINKRELPWRQTIDPYKIWISEIMLQQTRVAQAINYYNRFIEKYPAVTDLAIADEDEVLKLWQGLGYYSRARNLHLTAKIINDKMNGIFPADYPALLKLPGIGDYTAAAIAAIAYNQPVAAVDGNVYRVLSRFFGILTPIDSSAGRKEFKQMANSLLPVNKYGTYTQALMEFGALQCVPFNPDCQNCPLITNCFAVRNKLTGALPVKSKKIKPVSRYFYYYIIEDNHFVLLEKRTEKDIWKNLYQFPLFESISELNDLQLLQLPLPRELKTEVNISSVSPVLKHQLTHQTIFARFIYVNTPNLPDDTNGFLKVSKKDIFKFAVPRLLEPVIKKTGNG